MAEPEDPFSPTSKARRDAGFAAAELATFEAGLAATPAQRLAWLAEMLELARVAGAIESPQVPAGWAAAAPGSSRT